MLKALIKMLAISMGALMLAILAVNFVRWMGSQQSYKAPPHPWFERATWKIWSPPTEALCAPGGVDKSVPNVDWIVSVTVERREDVWFVACNPTPLPLKEFLAKQSRIDWLVLVRGHDTYGLDALIETLRPFEKTHHFAIVADAQKVSMYLRRKAPQMLFGADSSVLLRFQLFESLWIEPAMDFWPDFVITDFSAKFHLDARGAAELQRRQKRIIWNKLADENAAPPPQVNIQGLMTARPE